tara:strand:+ start:398 stop:814 length:417 start_codon:yes stop_codon:yes gene_type:complete
MEITEALKSLENSWSREKILVKIKNGSNSEKILDEFLNTQKKEIETLTNFINPEDNVLLSELEQLSYVESILIKKIKNLSLKNKQFSKFEKKEQKTDLRPQRKIPHNLGLFMMKWSNKFVFMTLIVISAIALTKQAWA